MRKVIKVISINLFILVCLLYAVSFFYKKEKLNNFDPKIREEYSQNYITSNETYGHGLVASTKVTFKKYKDEEKFIDVIYELDERGFRKTRHNPNNIKKRFALFFGGSNIFGVGLNDEQTLAFYFSKLAEDYRSYNYGVPGYGPQHVYLILQTENFKERVQQNSGIGVYRYFTFHRRRLMGTLKYMRWSKGSSPYFYLEGEELKRDGSFATGRPIITKILGWLGKVPFVESLDWEYPSFFSSETNSLLCKVIVDSQKKFLEIYPNSLFIVEIGIDTSSSDPLISNCLQKNNISYLDMRKHWNEKTMGDHRILPPFENHHGESVNLLTAQKLIEKFIHSKN